MKIRASHTTARFRTTFAALPAQVQERAWVAYRLWRANPWHASLSFKQVHPRKPIFSVRIGLGWRALGTYVNETVVWTWIGSHADYDKLVSRL